MTSNLRALGTSLRVRRDPGTRGGRVSVKETGRIRCLPASSWSGSPRRRPVPFCRLSDDELVGVLLAARRQIAREQYKQVLAIAEFGRRRQAAFEGAAARGVPVGCRPGGFPGEELAAELLTSRAEAGHRIDDAIDLTSRLPATLAGMRGGAIDEIRAGWIALYTRSLNAADTAAADEILAAAAPGSDRGTAGPQGCRAGNETQPRGGQGPPGTRQAERAAG